MRRQRRAPADGTVQPRGSLIFDHRDPHQCRYSGLPSCRHEIRGKKHVNTCLPVCEPKDLLRHDDDDDEDDEDDDDGKQMDHPQVYIHQS